MIFNSILQYLCEGSLSYISLSGIRQQLVVDYGYYCGRSLPPLFWLVLTVRRSCRFKNIFPQNFRLAGVLTAVVMPQISFTVPQNWVFLSSCTGTVVQYSIGEWLSGSDY